MIRKYLWFSCVVVLSWYAMMGAHEAGHVVGAWVSGGDGIEVRIPIWGFSQTTVNNNPHPLIEIWAGPMVGVLLPCVIAACVNLVNHDTRHWIKQIQLSLWFWAGFCLIANGLYIGLGWIDNVGDAGDLIRHGTPRWIMVGFGMCASGAGLVVWHVLIEKVRKNEWSLREA